MRLVRPSAKILPYSQSYDSAVGVVAMASAQCYNSALPDTMAELEEYIRKRVGAKHESILEHASVSAKFTVDRGVTHELVRHRLCAFTQESTRYCNYAKDRFGNHVTFIIPPWFDDIPTGVIQQIETFGISDDYEIAVEETFGGAVVFRYKDSTIADSYDGLTSTWLRSLLMAEYAYLVSLERGTAKPEEARSMLPNATKADIIVTANMREWRHIFRLRALGTTGRPHPQMLEVMVPLLAEFKQQYPVFFEDLEMPGEG